MKKLFKVILLSLFVFMLMACGSTAVESPKTEVSAPVMNVDDDEFARSTQKLNGEGVSKAQFAKDKTEILKIIDEIEAAMETKDFNKWLEYISPSSREFYSKPRKIYSNRGILVNNGLEDFFLHVFIPARTKGSLTEIETRYVSPTRIKAVKVKGKKDIIYYNFEKHNGKWYVLLPTNIAAE